MRLYISCRILLTGIFLICSIIPCFAAKKVKIKLTGSSYEQIQMTIGKTGRTEVISSFPYEFEVLKEDLPCRLKFQSEVYLYYDIDVPVKPYDTTGHVYLVKINETAMALRQNMPGNNNGQTGNIAVMGQTTLDAPIEGIDTRHGVNAAPITGVKNEKTVALIIANEDYEMAAKVDNASNDGLAVKEYCLKTLGIPSENIRYASNASYGKMKKAINDALDIVNMFNGEGNLIVYYAGHGIPDNKTKDAYLMPVDADGTDTDVCMSLGSLYDKINAQDISHCVFFIDACFSGAQRGGDMIVAARGVRLKPKEVEPTGKTIVFSATSGDETAFSHKEERHGLFTYYLLSKLQQTKGNVKLGELADYLREKVSIESRRINNVSQTPNIAVSQSLAESWQSLKLR